MKRRDLLKTAPVAVIAAGLPAVAASADAELLRLGAEFEAAFNVEEAARAVGREADDWDAWDEAYEVTSGLVRKIEKLQAQTFEGIRIKARCVQWCYGDDRVHIGHSDTTDNRLANQIINDLLAIRA